jgi:hypothetical protein
LIDLDAPVGRVAALDIPAAYGHNPEEATLSPSGDRLESIPCTVAQ